jgi:uncharacterized membrane protein
MAGIGFELRKVISKGGLSNVFNAALSGIMIVAGPWLLTMLTLFLINRIFDGLKLDHAGLFQAAIVYSYAFSLSLFSALHYLFTRLTADLLWENRQAEAAGWLLRFTAFTAVAGAALAGPTMALVPLGDLGDAGLFRAACVVLFVAVNLLWVMMLFISLLKWYVRIMLAYLGGMAASVALVYVFGSHWGVGGAVLGFGLGHLLIVAALGWLSLAAFPPRRPASDKAKLGHYLRANLAMVLSGFCFYLSQWIDKFFFWVTRGEGVEGSFFRLFNAYDLPVYLAGLSVIPGLVYFVIVSETSFYHALRKFLNALVRSPYAGIQLAKQEMIVVMDRELRDQNLFQGLFTLLAILLAAWFMPDPALRQTTWLMILGAYFQLVLMTVLNFLYYYELYRRALVGALAFLGLNGLGFPLLYLALPGLPLGIGYLGSVALASLVSWILLRQAVGSIDRRILLKAML